jgi:acyl carrier protein
MKNGRSNSMSSNTLATVAPEIRIFPATEVKRRLREHLQKIADEAAVLRPEWEPLLDSKRVVGVVLVLENLFPFKIPPDKVVRKGGYNSVNDAVDDISGRVENFAADRSKSKVHK